MSRWPILITLLCLVCILGFMKYGNKFFCLSNVWCNSGVTPAIFREICHEREQQMRKFRMSLFDPDTEILYITVPSQPHETMHSELYQEIMDLFVHGNLRHSWKVTQSTRYDGEGQKPGATSAGEGDSGGKPRDKRPDARDWPTLVIEAGYSSTLPTMRQKMQWWFNASKYKVKIVILVYFSSTRLRGGELDILTLEKWVAHGQQRRPGASNTRAFPGVAPALVHTNQVTYSGPALTAANYTDIPLSQFQVSRGDLILEFCQLMLREPQAGSGEGDFVITVTALQRWARSVWEDLASLSGNFALLNLPTIEQRPLF